MLGASGSSYPGWIRTDIAHLNICIEKDWTRYFKEASLDAMLAEHVFEHLTREEASRAATNCFKFLKPGGHLRIAVPDGNFPDKNYVDSVKPMGYGPGSDDHKILYTYTSLADQLRSIGFTIRLLEYWDEAGNFHYTPWNAEDGMIRRSRWHDQRNSEQEIKYTSLILDAIKP